MQKLPSRVCVCVHVMYVSNFSSKPYLSRAIVIYCHLLTYFAYLNLWEVLKSQRFEWKDTVSSARGRPVAWNFQKSNCQRYADITVVSSNLTPIRPFHPCLQGLGW